MVVGDLSEGTDVLVIGSGPGGYVAAIRAAQLGLDVTIVEREDIGGVCLNSGCIPSKALITMSAVWRQLSELDRAGITVKEAVINPAKLQAWKNDVVHKLTGGVEQLLKGNRVRILRGRAEFTRAGEAKVDTGHEVKYLAFRDAIIATGSRPVPLSSVPWDGQRVVDSTGLLNGETIPDRLAVIGGGYIGLELGTVYAKLGSRVTIIEATPNLLPGVDRDLVRPVEQVLHGLAVDVLTATTVTDTRKTGDEVYLQVESNGASRTIACDVVLVAVGRQPNTDNLGLDKIGIVPDGRGFIAVDERRRTTAAHVYAIGDVTGGPLLAHKASREARVAAEVIGGDRGAAYDAVAVPAVIFTDPEIATVGLSEDQARQQGYEPIVGRFPFTASGRALTMGQTAGFVRLVGDKATGVVIGAQVVGPEASTLIAEAALAIECGLTLSDLAQTIHAHPTLPEAVMEAAESALGNAVHVLTTAGRPFPPKS